MRKISKPEQADIAVADALEPIRNSRPIRALGTLSEVADQPPLISICAATLVVGLLLRNRKLAYVGGRMLAAELVSTKLKTLVKDRVDRTRPATVADGHAYKAEAGNTRTSDYSSFPSGHSAGAITVARSIARVYPEHAFASYATAAAIGAIQVPRSKHYVTDVAAGFVVGLVGEQMVALADGLVRRLMAPAPAAIVATVEVGDGVVIAPEIATPAAPVALAWPGIHAEAG